MSGGDVRVRFVVSAGPLTVGVDVGTTSVKALAVDHDGAVVGRSRVPHQIVAPEPDLLEHHAVKAWRLGPRRALKKLLAGLDAPIAGLTVAAMVPSLAAVDRRGVPLTPGILYGDVRGRPASPTAAAHQSGDGSMPDAEGFLSWARAAVPDAAGYWPAQAVATAALTGVGAIDSAAMASMGRLQTFGQWDEGVLAEFGVHRDQMPVVVPMCQGGPTVVGTDAVATGGTVDAMCDQIVSGANEVGDVLAIFGATLIAWAVTDSWTEIPGLITVPHTTAGRVLIGGPSNAGALFIDWARQLLRGLAPHERSAGGPLRPADPRRVPVWLPYLRGERTPFHDPALRASLHDVDIGHSAGALERAAYESSGFVIRRLLERSGVQGSRIVASGGGSRVGPWMAAVADATSLPVESVAVPEGAAFGAAYLARMAAGLEEDLEGAARWAAFGARVEPDPKWAKWCDQRYQRFEELSPRAS
jgi:xylulokinase